MTVTGVPISSLWLNSFCFGSKTRSFFSFLSLQFLFAQMSLWFFSFYKSTSCFPLIFGVFHFDFDLSNSLRCSPSTISRSRSRFWTNLELELFDGRGFKWFSFLSILVRCWTIWSIKQLYNDVFLNSSNSGHFRNFELFVPVERVCLIGLTDQAFECWLKRFYSRDNKFFILFWFRLRMAIRFLAQIMHNAQIPHWNLNHGFKMIWQ